MLSGYTYLIALLLPLAILIFFFTRPDLDFRPQELDDMPVEKDTLEEEGAWRNDGRSDAGSMEGEAGSDYASGSHGAGPGSSSSPNAHSDSGSEPDPSSHSDRERDDSPEEWTEAEQQQSPASCYPQYTAWAGDLNPEDMDKHGMAYRKALHA
jgi:hypothetical protein